MLWRSVVVVPPQGHEAVLKELHVIHRGTSKMKALAHSYIWWLQMEHFTFDFAGPFLGHYVSSSCTFLFLMDGYLVDVFNYFL